jgi:hypothetical protein
MKSHTGGAMSLGAGVIYGTSKRQKLNTKSSTEAEVVGTDDVMPQMLWTLYFLEAQGYKIDDNLLYQDNKSSILLETNGRGSSGKRTRHMNVRYFFIADRVKSKEIRIEYCPTGIMLADYFTKPLQGLLFRQLRDMIMGNVPIALPSDSTGNVSDPPMRIPVNKTLTESRSVLEVKNAIVRSPRVLTVLPINRKTVKFTDTAVGPGKAHTTVSKSDTVGDIDSSLKTDVANPNVLRDTKRTLSWAQIASGKNRSSVRET